MEAIIVAIVIGVAVAAWGVYTSHERNRKAIETADFIKTAEMYARLYDDPDFIKDMGLTEEEQRYLHR